MDATYLKSDNLFSSLVFNSSLQKEIQDEEKNWPGFEDNQTQMSEKNKTMNSEEKRVDADIILRAEFISFESETESP